MWIPEFVGSPLNSAPEGSAHLPHPSPGPKGFSLGLTGNFAAVCGLPRANAIDPHAFRGHRGSCWTDT